jgi:hypothetical protein
MLKMDFSIIKHNTSKIYYELRIDDKCQLDNIPLGELRRIFLEMEKFARLRFKGELNHKKRE